jgi:hypothetical protein
VRRDEFQAVAVAYQRHDVQYSQVAHLDEPPCKNAPGDRAGAQKRNVRALQMQLLHILGLRCDVLGELLQMGEITSGIWILAQYFALRQFKIFHIFIYEHRQQLAR